MITVIAVFETLSYTLCKIMCILVVSTVHLSYTCIVHSTYLYSPGVLLVYVEYFSADPLMLTSCAAAASLHVVTVLSASAALPS